MNKWQKNILLKFILVIAVTSIVMAAMVHFRDWVNHTEAMRTMEDIGEIITKYRKDHGFVPPKSYVDRIIEDLPGSVRLGKINYRARWIDLDSKPDEILAYKEKKYNTPFINDGFIVLRLNGKIEWMNSRKFKNLLTEQQDQFEKEMTETKDY